MEESKTIIQTISLPKKEYKRGIEIYLSLEAIKLCRGNISFEHALAIATDHHNWWVKIMDDHELAPGMDLRFDKFTGTIQIYGEYEVSNFRQTCGFNINEGSDIEPDEIENTSAASS